MTLNCPIPFAEYPKVLMAHGGGGRLTQQLIDKIFVPSFNNPILEQRHDGAAIELGSHKLAFTTDSYVVKPLFFPGGDIGTLAVNGTINDLAMCGAQPQWLSAGFIIEEGLEMDTLWRIAQSMRAAALAAGVLLVTGDTKVVDKGKGDGLFINTAGIGVIQSPTVIAPSSVRVGDAIIISGDLGRHGIAIMSQRTGLEFETTIESDCASLAAPVLEMIRVGVEIHCLRDLTRGGLASALNEIAVASGTQIEVDERQVPIRDEVQGACEILGLDPLYVANEGRFIVVVPSTQIDTTLRVLKRFPVAAEANLIGRVSQKNPGLVTIRSKIGAERILDLLSGEQLPRIC